MINSDVIITRFVGQLFPFHINFLLLARNKYQRKKLHTKKILFHIVFVFKLVVELDIFSQ